MQKIFLINACYLSTFFILVYKKIRVVLFESLNWISQKLDKTKQTLLQQVQKTWPQIHHSHISNVSYESNVHDLND